MNIALRGAAVGLALAAGFASPVAAKTLIFCPEASPENFNPQINTTGTSFDAAGPIYNNLVQFERGSTEVVPALAEEWTVSEDGRTYTFTLREGVKVHPLKDFTPTRDLNADDVIFTFERMWKTDHPYHAVSGGEYDYFADMGMPELLEAVEKVDDRTVRFTLKRTEAPFIANMAMPFASILSKEYGDFLLAKGTPERIDQEPVGTGPFQFVAYQKDAVIRYRAFPDYWRGAPKVDNLVFSITPDASVRFAKLQRGECHVIPYPNPADLQAMEADPNIDLMSREGLNIGYLAFNVGMQPFDDKRVRLALNMAIDKQSIIDTVYQGAGVPAKNPIPPTIWSYNDEIEPIPYDPEKARALLAEAGVSGLQTELWAMPVQRPYNPNAQRVAEMIQEDLSKVGVQARIVSYEWGEYRKRLQAGEAPMSLFGWTGDNGDPDNFLNVLLGCESARPGGSNVAKWCDRAFDDLVQQARQLTDQGERTELYRQAQVVFHEELPWFPIAHSVWYQPVRTEVVDFRISPFGLHDFDGVDIRQ